jgi:MFS family permease
MGAALAVIPFYIGYAKKTFTLDSATLGYVLLVQIIGMFAASFIFPRIIKKNGFKGVLRFRIILHVVIPVFAILIGNTGTLSTYLAIFFLVGFALSARLVSEDAALIELSTEENRVIYSALAGTLNIAIIVFPIVLGFLISSIGYQTVFIISSIITLSAFPVLKSLCCPVDKYI